MKLTEPLLICDKTSPYTGKIYPYEEVLKMVKQYNSTPLHKRYGLYVKNLATYSVDMPLNSISHTTDSIFLEGNHLMAEVSILSTPEGQEVIKNIENLRLSPVISYTTDKKQKIMNMMLIRTDFVFNNRTSK
ncbi:MAG: hypothetical protein QXL17_02710 [Candidatus Thermoplasmatota archaeon]